MFPLIQMLVIRGFRDTLFTHGASAGLYPIFFYIIITITPYCLLTGFILPYAQKVLKDNQFPFTSGDLYITDSGGDIAGGILFSFILVYWLKPFPTALLIMVGVLLLVKYRMNVFFLIALLSASLFYYYSLNSLFEKHTLVGQYGEIVRYLDSPYGRIVISKEGTQHTFWESGAPLYSDANVISSEEKVHYPLCQLDKVEIVLLVSGGLGETLREVSK